MTYSDINTLESPLFNSSLNKPIISYSTYIRNKHRDLDCNYWKVHLFDDIHLMDVMTKPSGKREIKN